MVNRNSTCSSPATLLDRVRTQVHKLELLSRSEDGQDLKEFDAETEDLLVEAFGAASESLEAYKYATVGDAERMTNLAVPAQTSPSQHVPPPRLHHRRQILEGCISLLEGEYQEKVHRSSLSNE